MKTKLTIDGCCVYRIRFRYIRYDGAYCIQTSIFPCVYVGVWRCVFGWVCVCRCVGVCVLIHQPVVNRLSNMVVVTPPPSNRPLCRTVYYIIDTRRSEVVLIKKKTNRYPNMFSYIPHVIRALLSIRFDNVHIHSSPLDVCFTRFFWPTCILALVQLLLDYSAQYRLPGTHIHTHTYQL